ncbi:UDP-N-acetylmuramoyl-L-alanine--D-glutamate ligase [Limoniibacter endophyticus]|uniref:UDP-N-acetylmuramoylalanine--D-glutamate ligase n=1 Tax=Limoniibacter endophyticus TaxID=1565040 RepID=A0A8J3DNV5_9HYPH|nr:UDP-N-acetylmuramoyl-L-alanine--D-glutamate ligase [Limoniibacter endophyticus]GHC75181.1 UDP-N-acetylmuramoylalanine--D-glutamate ligase [Limoniibacter endophyticus]
MIPASRFKDKKVALFGLGGSGLATAHALVAGGADLIASDDNPDSVAKAASEGVGTGDLHNIDWAGLAAFVLSPGVPLTHPKPHWSVDLARAAAVEIIGDVELFSRERAALAPSAPLVAVTGTNGKSTTTALISHMLKSAGRDTQMGGNIGRAVLTLEPVEPARHYVIECSSYQIDLAPTLKPSCGILLNLTPDHLDRHGTMAHYAEIKERLVANSDLAIVGVDDTWCADIAQRLERAGRRVARISARLPLTDGYFASGLSLCHARGGQVEIVGTLEGVGSLRGRHNAQNALAAIAACREVGLSHAEIQAGLSSFKGLAHRMEQVGRKGNVLFVNDSKATNAEASAPALASFETIYWIVGGLPKQGGIESLRPLFDRVKRAYLIGEAAPAFSATLGDAVPFEISGTLEAALAHAARDAAGSKEEGEAVVLLSPACASFDQFRNFEVRGEAFRKAVSAIEDIEMMGAQSW